MSEANNVHPSEVGLAVAVAEAGPVLSKKELAKLANIIGFFRDAAEAVFPVQGLEVMTDPSQDVLRERLEALKPGTLVAQRARLESDPYFRHPIPYILIFRQREDGEMEFFVYQRTKLIGEEKLGQKFSIALGGHPEAPSIRFHDDWSFNTTESLMACLVSELDEEATFNGMSFSDYSETGGMFTYGHEGFLRDDSDAVGRQHIGIVYTIGLPAGVEVECKEDELLTVGFRTLTELAADLELPEVNALYDFENWSKICIRSYVERIEAAKAAEAVDAMFLGDHGHDEAVETLDDTPEDVIGRGMTKAVLHIEEMGLTEGLSRGADGVLYFNIDPADPDPVTTIARLQEIYKETVKAVLVDEGQEAPVDQKAAFAQAIIDKLEDSDGLVESPAVWQGTGNPVDPSAETKILTELHREVGTTDAQMKDAVTELVRISDSVQPEAEAEAVRLSDLAS